MLLLTQIYIFQAVVFITLKNVTREMNRPGWISLSPLAIEMEKLIVANQTKGEIKSDRGKKKTMCERRRLEKQN